MSENIQERALLASLTNRQRLAFAFYTLFHSQGRRLVYWRKQWWQWGGTHYNPLDGDTLESVLSKFIESEFSKATPRPPNLTRSILSDVFTLLQMRCTTDANREAPFSLLSSTVTSPEHQHISLANGVLDVGRALTTEAAELYPHDPEWFSLAALPFAYDPAAVCPKWDHFLAETFEGDIERVAFIEEWLGYCCVYDYSYQHAVILAGEGANGKGVLTKVTIALLGKDNVSHVPLELFGQRFQLSPTIGKLLNTAPEIAALDKAAEEQLKAVTGGDRITIDVKYGSHVQTAMTARLMFSTNEIPTFFDRSGGLKRRLIIIPFNRVVPDGQQNSRLHEELISELPGIFNRVLQGLRRLRERGKFAIPTISQTAVQLHMLSSNPARTFLEERTSADPEVATFSIPLYTTYREWFEECGYPMSLRLAQPQFAQEVARHFGIKAEQIGWSDRRRLYRGLRCDGCEMVSA